MKLQSRAEVPHSPGDRGQRRRIGTRSAEAGGSEGDDERPRDDISEIVPDEGLHIVEQANSVGLLHHLSAGVREHQVSVVRSAVRLVPIILADFNAVETMIFVQSSADLRIDGFTIRCGGSRVTLSMSFVYRLGSREEA